jgi:hypothetical protein
MQRSSFNVGDLVLVQASFSTKRRKKFAIVLNQHFESIKVKFVQTGIVRDYLKCYITPVTAETK